MWMLLLLLIPVLTPFVASLVHDPAPGVTRAKSEARNEECVGMSEASARRLYPGVVTEPPPRGSYIDTSAVVCRGNVMEADERPRRDRTHSERGPPSSRTRSARGWLEGLKMATSCVEGRSPSACHPRSVSEPASRCNSPPHSRRSRAFSRRFGTPVPFQA